MIAPLEQQQQPALAAWTAAPRFKVYGVFIVRYGQSTHVLVIRDRASKDISFPGGSVDMLSNTFLALSEGERTGVLASEFIRECREELGTFVMQTPMPLISEKDAMNCLQIHQDSEFESARGIRVPTKETYYCADVTHRIMQFTQSSCSSVAIRRFLEFANNRCISRSDIQCTEVDRLEFVDLQTLSTSSLWSHHKKIVPRVCAKIRKIKCLDTYGLRFDKIPAWVKRELLAGCELFVPDREQLSLMQICTGLLSHMYDDELLERLTLENAIELSPEATRDPLDMSGIWTLTCAAISSVPVLAKSVLMDSIDLEQGSGERLWIQRRFLGGLARIILAAHADWKTGNFLQMLQQYM